MSSIDDLVDSFRRQLQQYGLDESLAGVETAKAEIQEIQDRMGTLLQDFRYDNVQKVADLLRASQYELSGLRGLSAAASGAINEAIVKIRNA